ncbi:hypothetical protein KQI77_07950 [Clostridium sp. MSJ-8]|uniref:hypothetical protein n=1 Tax=Clostridium sp. MSJ-8 TaxID=2841510 RepID=UPI001C0ED39B|nr:hypothetical protein [Clostridium sp. MSJ-8]MBU5488090.1 hypothetical protein [Clostridium sp. MSJ-8]
MRAKIIKQGEDYNKEFKVRRLNYEEVIVNYPIDSLIKHYKYEEVELISEGDIDEFLIDNREFLQIRLKRGISAFFYKALKETLYNELQEEIESFILLRDKYNVNKRGIWEKEIICFVNQKKPLLVSASGRNFRRDNYSISVTDFDDSEFLSLAREEIKKISREIEYKQSVISRYDIVINKLTCNKPN